MVVDRDAKSPGATTVQRAALPTARLMEGVGDVNTWGAPKVPRVKLTFASRMAGVGGVGSLEVAPRLPGANQVFALGMVGGRGARWKDALEVLRGRPVFAYPMGEGAGANSQDVPKVLKEARCFARPMEGGSGAYLPVVPRGPRGAHHSARAMVGVSGACLMGAGSAPRVFMVGPTFAWLMVGGSGARSRTVGKAPKEALSSAKLIEVGRDAIGVMESVRNLQGGEAGNVQPTTWLRSVNTSSKA